MSTREYVDNLIDRMNEAQLKALAEFITNFTFIEATTPNEETLEALDEVRSMKEDPSKYKGYTDVDKMMEELLK